LGDVRGKRLMDIGTRHGQMAMWFAERGANVVGLDIDDAPFEAARLQAHRRNLDPQVEFRTYSGDPLELPKGFDIVFAKSTVVLMEPQRAAEGLHGSLVSGGKLLLVENARGPFPLHLARMIRRMSLRPHGARYFTQRTLDIFSERFEIALVRWYGPTVLIGAIRR
jgi:SAM-dependent methyltransferase